MRAGTILFCGDPHGRFQHIIDAVGRLHPMAVVFLGDMQPKKPLHNELEGVLKTELWYIHGNHDTDWTDEKNRECKYWDNIWGSTLADRNIHGRVVTLPNGIRLAGLGGVFRGLVWDPRLPEPFFRNQKEHTKSTPRQDRWKGSVHLRHWSTIYPDDLNQLASQRADVLVTHEAPGYHDYGFKILDDLARSLGAKVSVHGHQHDQIDSSDKWQQQGFKSFGIGLRGITAIDADGNVETIVLGEIDSRHDISQK